MANEDLIVGLDIGTTKICVIVGERNEKGIINITGIGVKPSVGMRKGVIVNIEATIKSIHEAVYAAEMMCGREVHACWTGIGGNHIEGINSRGVVAIAGQKREKNREINKEDIYRVIEAARAVVIPLDRQIIQTIPQTYNVDNHRRIKDPLGMIGVRLEAEVHIITSSATSAENLLRCVNRTGFKVNDSLLLQVLAAGRAVLTPEEQDLGVALIDLGGGTTDVLVYYDGAPYSTFTIPVGGYEVTKDISTIKSISIEEAERVKTKSACCWEPMLEGSEDIIVPGMGGRAPMAIPRSHIYGIVKPRMEEIFELVKQKLDCLGLPRPLSGGIVLTGGGAALNGAVELAGEIFKLPVRLGIPIRFANLGGLVDEYRDPGYATAIGLVLEGDRREKDEFSDWVIPIRPGHGSNGSQGPLKKIEDFFEWIKNGLF
ncbi:MAG: cell division protein FtsA [Treponema sp.]|nr:cell division protein FtsA [Treponema sp.]